MNARTVGTFIELALKPHQRSLLGLQPGEYEECGKAFIVNDEPTKHQKNLTSSEVLCM